MAKYSYKFKEEIVRKKLSGRPVIEISKETGVTDVTIYDWVKKFSAGKLTPENDYPKNYPIMEKYKLVNQLLSVDEKEKGKWLRENGVHPDHINKCGDEIESILLKPENYKTKYKEIQLKLKKTEKELQRKEKALAEAAALLVLKKKYQALWEGEES